MTSIDAWSFSRYNTYTQCPAKFKYQYIDKLDQGPPSEALIRGREVHKAAEDYLTGKRPDIDDSLKTRADLLEAIKPMSPMVEQKWGIAENWKPTTYFNRKGRPAVWLRGSLDVGLDYGDGSYEVVDWKTGKKWGSNEEQMELFATMVFARYPDIQTVYTRLSYVDLQPGPDSETYGEYNRDKFAALKKTWEDRVEPMFNDEDWLPRPNKMCAYCPYSLSAGGPCRHG